MCSSGGSGMTDSVPLRPSARLRPRHTRCGLHRQNDVSAGFPALQEVVMRYIPLALIACVAAVTASAQDARIPKGEEIYAAQKCALCHSIGDKGNRKGPLDGVGSKLSHDELRQWIVDAKGMTAK